MSYDREGEGGVGQGCIVPTITLPFNFADIVNLAANNHFHTFAPLSLDEILATCLWLCLFFSFSLYSGSEV